MWMTAESVSILHGDRKCFLKTPGNANYSLTFWNNNAKIAGDDIYGGQTETCINGLDSVT